MEEHSKKRADEMQGSDAIIRNSSRQCPGQSLAWTDLSKSESQAIVDVLVDHYGEREFFVVFFHCVTANLASLLLLASDFSCASGNS